jgi:hypothetical protein
VLGQQRHQQAAVGLRQARLAVEQDRGVGLVRHPDQGLHVEQPVGRLQDAALVLDRLAVDAQPAQQVVQRQHRLPGEHRLAVLVVLVLALPEELVGQPQAVADGLGPLLQPGLLAGGAGARRRQGRQAARGHQHRPAALVQQQGQLVAAVVQRHHPRLAVGGDRGHHLPVERPARLRMKAAHDLPGRGLVEQERDAELLLEDDRQGPGLVGRGEARSAGPHGTLFEQHALFLLVRGESYHAPRTTPPITFPPTTA